MAVSGIGISAALLIGILKYEGYRDEAYIPVPGDVPTIGAGRTEGVKMGDKTNPVREMQYLYNNINDKYAAGVRKCITVPLYPHEFEALINISYNAGVGAVCRELAPKFNAARTDEDYARACAAIEGWRVTVGGRDCRDKKNNCRGLVVRRKAQRAQCEGAAHGQEMADGATLS
jgi:lysozyme